MRKIILSLALFSLLSVSLSTVAYAADQGTPAPATTQGSPDGTDGAAVSSGTILSADEATILQMVNAERAKAGLAPLTADPRLVETARAKSRDMIDLGYFDHQSPDLGSPFDQMKQAGIGYQFAGENIAAYPSAEEAMNGWMNSPEHRANILDPNFTRIGIGVVDGGPCGKMLTQQFIGE